VRVEVVRGCGCRTIEGRPTSCTSSPWHARHGWRGQAWPDLALWRWVAPKAAGRGCVSAAANRPACGDGWSLCVSVATRWCLCDLLLGAITIIMGGGCPPRRRWRGPTVSLRVALLAVLRAGRSWCGRRRFSAANPWRERVWRCP
jgi:hypothetical protein